MKAVHSYLINSGVACVALYYAEQLSRGYRGAIDWAVLALVTGAILYNLYRLGQRLYRRGGGNALWHLQRTLLFWIIGLFNTLLARPEDAGSWKQALGWALIALVPADSIALYRKERSYYRADAGDTD